MSRAIQSGLILVAASTAVWILLMLAFMPILEVKFYPRYTVPLAVIFPIFFARPIANFIIRKDARKMTLNEVIILSGLVARIVP